METLTVSLGERSYPIYIGDNLLGNPELIKPFLKSSQVCIVTNSTVAPLYLDKVKAALSGLQIRTVVLPDGEKHKTLADMNRPKTKIPVRDENGFITAMREVFEEAA